MTPVEIARQALHNLAAQGLPPTPENYETQYRAIAGRPLPPPSPPPAPGLLLDSPEAQQALEMVRTLLQLMTNTNIGLQADLTRFNDESNAILEQAAVTTNITALNEIFFAMTSSSRWLLSQVDHTREELESTRKQLDQVHSELAQAQQMAASDLLTGLPNRRGLDTTLAREVARARRHRTPLCVAMLDLDHFKRVNDDFGHVIGDRALCHFAEVVKSTVRETDVLTRFGGEEFVLLLPDTALVRAEFILNRTLRAMEHSPLTADNHEIVIRFSAGLAEWQPEETPAAVIRRADEAMYQAKSAGRGRVVVAEASARPAA